MRRLASLRCWARQEEEASPIRLWLSDHQEVLTRAQTDGLMPEPEMGQLAALSEWTLAAWCVDQRRAQVRGTISPLHVHACLPCLIPSRVPKDK